MLVTLQAKVLVTKIPFALKEPVVGTTRILEQCFVLTASVVFVNRFQVEVTHLVANQMQRAITANLQVSQVQVNATKIIIIGLGTPALVMSALVLRYLTQHKTMVVDVNPQLIHRAHMSLVYRPMNQGALFVIIMTWSRQKPIAHIHANHVQPAFTIVIQQKIASTLQIQLRW